MCLRCIEAGKSYGVYFTFHRESIIEENTGHQQCLNSVLLSQTYEWSSDYLSLRLYVRLELLFVNRFFLLLDLHFRTPSL